jgi:hypothetical protein
MNTTKMLEQMMERLLARMDANMKTMQEKIMKEMTAYKEQMVSLLSRIANFSHYQNCMSFQNN